MSKKNILIDMSATIIHHGHIRLLKRASRYGDVFVGLTVDRDLLKFKNINPEASSAGVAHSTKGITLGCPE